MCAFSELEYAVRHLKMGRGDHGIRVPWSDGGVSDEMLERTPSLGQLVDSIHNGLDADRLSMVYVGFSMKDARQLCEDAAAEAYARTLGQVPADCIVATPGSGWVLQTTRPATTPDLTLLVTKMVPAQNTNTIATGRVAACQSPRTMLTTRPSATSSSRRLSCASVILEGTPDENKLHDDV